jgi:ABC-type dipeptide/oligopeptide/nickel transport system permease subunit
LSNPFYAIISLPIGAVASQAGGWADFVVMRMIACRIRGQVLSLEGLDFVRDALDPDICL